jgi:hypothetical protein
LTTCDRSNKTFQTPSQASVTKSQVEMLGKAITKVKFFSLQNEYATEKDGCKVVATDHPSVIITISSGKQKKSIDRYLGCAGHADLEQLTIFEDTIDKIVNSAQWIDRK